MINETRRIQSVERAMYILEQIALAGGHIRLNDLAARTGLNKATLHGLLNTLAALGYIGRDGKSYTLGLRLRDLTLPLSDADEHLRRRFRPLMETLHRTCGENVYLAAPCGTREYRYLDVLGHDTRHGHPSPRGRREGLTTSAMGKVFLATIPETARSLLLAGRLSGRLKTELAQIAECGYALDLAEAEAGWHAFAVPLRVGGQTVAGISVAGAAERLPSAKLIEWAQHTQQLLLHHAAA
ncbi:helix-turn-helix domain-containing protein [Neisseria leonii]|uniref:Helix-turn-helix domain-containing protein n=1 Tax=Neisseria leonii TaxID=2995413 RepID=A0A9X4IEK9_9NEIS|nr:helix-turn-helix domain-containing protein [Neisseria sp. 51.81]MDD9328302.1 helix-turn-helix domain-containing protein [Neisseria sp. 51.81]